MDRVFTYKNLVHAVAGACGGATAITMFYPLNIARSRVQVSDSAKVKSALGTMADIVKRDGVPALYQGWRASVVALGCSNFVYFYTYNMFKAVYATVRRRAGDSAALGPGMNLAIAALAGCVNVLATTPLWVVGMRLSVQRKKGHGSTPDPYDGIVDTLVRISREEGVAALWNGVGPSLVLVSNPSIQFVVYERLRIFVAAAAASRGTPIRPAEFFLMGAVAKAVATIVTYPLQIAQSRLRTSRVSSDKSAAAGTPAAPAAPVYTGTIDCLQKLYAAYGVEGLFRGMSTKLWQTVLTAAFQFAMYEKIFSLIVRILTAVKPVEAVAQ